MGVPSVVPYSRPDNPRTILIVIRRKLRQIVESGPLEQRERPLVPVPVAAVPALVGRLVAVPRQEEGGLT